MKRIISETFYLFALIPLLMVAFVMKLMEEDPAEDYLN